MELDLFQILLLIGFGNSVILLFSFTRIRERYRKPALFLGLFVAGYLLYQANFVIIPDIQRNLTFVIPKLPILLFLPALVLFFTESALDAGFRMNRNRRLLLLPGLADLVYQTFSWLYLQYGGSGPLRGFLTGRSGHFTYEGVGIVFSTLCIILLLRCLWQSEIRKSPAYRFFRFVIAGLTIILLRWIVLYSIDLTAPGSYPYSLQYYFWQFDTVFLLYTGYKILTTPKILKTDPGGFTRPSGEEMELYVAELKALLDEQKLYLDPGLSRKDLAEKLNISEVHVSSIINEGLQSSFYEMINQYRLEEAIRLMRAGRLEQITVEALAEEAGFRSKSTFNKVFKEHTGTTPTRYRDDISSV